MKVIKKILGTTVFLGIGVVLFMTISYLLRPVDATFRKRVTGFYAEEKNSLDIVTVGSSAMYAYFNNPYLWQEYGLTSYNMATPGQSVFLLEDLIDEINKNQSPQLYIVDTRKMTFVNKKSANSNRFTMVYDNLNYTWNRIEMINSLLDTWPERFQAYFDIYTYHDSWEEFSIENLQYYDNDRKHELKGWRNISAVQAIEEPVIEENLEALPISDAAEGALISLLEKCKAENLQVLFLATPWEINEKCLRKNQYLEQIIESYGFHFLDCNLYLEEMGMDFSTDFYNRRHTNMLGAEKMTKFVGEYIMEHYDLETDHSPEVEADWNNMLELHNSQAEVVRAEILNAE